MKKKPIWKHERYDMEQVADILVHTYNTTTIRYSHQTQQLYWFIIYPNIKVGIPKALFRGKLDEYMQSRYNDAEEIARKFDFPTVKPKKKRRPFRKPRVLTEYFPHNPREVEEL